MQDATAKKLTPQLEHYTKTINALHSSWSPEGHPGQITVGRAIFNENKKKVFVQCGRKWGKTEIIIYTLWRWCQSFPNQSCYYISPFYKQSKEIIWANNRVQTFGPRDWLLPGSQGINKSELRITFKNGSFIKLDGSENFEAYRGIEPHLMVYEEFKDFRPEFHVAMDPNLAVYEAPLLVIGTPPDRECQFLDIAKDFYNDPEGMFITEPSERNPHISKEWLSKKKKELLERGEWDVWEREYMGKYVPGGISKIFPMLSRKKHIVPHRQILDEIKKDRKKMSWYVIADPAGSSVFGLLFCCVNHYTKKWYFLDEIYENDQKEMTTRKIMRRVKQKTEELYPSEFADWRYIYDEQATWFKNEAFDFDETFFEPTQKALNKKESGLTLIKDSLFAGKVAISDRCVKLFWEADNYFKDKNGKIPKENDHLLDCWRYAYAADNYELNTVDEPQPDPEEDKWQKNTFETDFPELGDPFDIEEEW